MSTNDRIIDAKIRVRVTKVSTTDATTPKTSKTDNSEEDDNAAEVKRISDILTNQQNISRRTEVGAVVRIKMDMLLDKEKVEAMRCEYVYGVITNLEDWCKTTGSRAYQVSWVYSHLSIGNAFLSLISPVFEHDLEVVKFLDDIDDGKDEYFTNQFKRVDDAWKIVEFCGPKCEFCEGIHVR